MKVKYVGNHDAVDVHGVGVVQQGEAVEVSAEVGKSLLEQDTNWQPGEVEFSFVDIAAIDKATVTDLKAFAEAEGIDISGLRVKREIADAIADHLDKQIAAAAAADSPEVPSED